MAIAKLSIDIEARLAGFEKEMQKVAQSAEGMAGRVKSSFSALGGAVGVAFGALATAGVVGQFKELVNYLDKFDEAAERIGSSSEDLSALAYAAKLSGVEFDELNKGLVKFSGTLTDAANGNREAIDLLNRLGVSAKNYDNLNAAVTQAADKFALMKDGVAKTALATDAFGDKLGSKMVPLLNQGGAGLEKARIEAEKLGAIIGPELSKQAADFNDNLDRLGTLAGAAGKSIASGLLPWLNEAAESFLIARKNSDSFWDTLNKKIPGLQIVDVAKELRDLNYEYGQIDFRLSNGRGKAGDEERAAALLKQINYYNDLNASKNKADAPTRTATVPPPAPKTGRSRTSSGKSEIDFNDELARILKDVNKELEDRAKLADQIAKEADGYRNLIDPSRKYREELARIAELVESGNLSPLEGMEATAVVQKQLDDVIYGVNDRLEDQKDLAKEIGLTFSSAFEDAVIGGRKFSEILNALIADLAKLALRKTVTEPMINALGSINWGGLFGGSTTPASAVQLANGGVFNSPSLSAYSGGVYSSPQLFAFANGAGIFGEAGPEAIMPLSRGADGKLGVKAQGSSPNVNITVNNQAASQGFEATATARQNGAGFDIEVLVAKAVLGDQRRNGPITQGFGQMFNLARGT